MTIRARLAALDRRFVRSVPEDQGTASWWRMSRTVKQGLLLALGWTVLSVMGWLRVAFGDAGALGLTIAIGSSLLGGSYLASSLALRRQRQRGRG